MGAVPDWLVRRLRGFPGATVRVDDTLGRLGFRLAAGPEVQLDVRADARLSGPAARALAANVLAHPERSATRPLGAPPEGATGAILAVDAFRPAVRAELLQAGLSWAEQRSGYLHLVAPPYVLHLDGSDVQIVDRSVDHASASPSTPVRRRRPTTLRGQSGTCVETLLLWAHARSTHVHPKITPTELAALAGVTVPLAHAVLHRLEQVGALTPNRVGRRTFGWHLTRPALALDQWAAEDRPKVLETTVFMLARAPLEFLRHLTRLDHAGIPWAVGGVRAADLYAPTLTAPPALTVWVPNDVPASTVAAALKGQVVDGGATLTLRQTAKDPWMRHRLRLQDGLLVTVPAEARTAVSESDRDKDRDQGAMHDVAHGATIPWSDRLDPALPRWRRELVEGLTLISPPRAYVETLADGRGRFAEVAEALRDQLAFDEPRTTAGTPDAF
jgi:hypothetical protein